MTVRTDIASCGADACRAARFAFVTGALASLCAFTAPTGAGAQAFRLDSRQLDQVIAGGISAGADAVASGFGSGPALTDTRTESSLNPGNASAVARATAAAPDGSHISTLISVVGEDNTRGIALSSGGDALSLDSSAIRAAAGGTLRIGASRLTAQTGASTNGGEGVTVASTRFQSVNGGSSVGGSAGADAFGGGPTTASNSLDFRTSNSGFMLKMQADGSGGTDGSAFASTTSDLQDGDAKLSLNAQGEAVGGTASASSSQMVKVSGSRMIVLSNSSARSSEPGGATSDTSINADGISSDSIRSMQRTIQTNRMSRSVSMAIIDLR